MENQHLALCKLELNPEQLEPTFSFIVNKHLILYLTNLTKLGEPTLSKCLSNSERHLLILSPQEKGSSFSRGSRETPH